MLWIKLVKKIIKVLNSDISPSRLAGGIALGSIIGFTPLQSLHNIVVFLLIMLLKVNIGAAFLGIALFKVVAVVTDPIAHRIGYWLLVENNSLSSTWTALYNMPLVPYTHFNNTVVLGSFIISLILFVPVLIGSKKFIMYYRANLQERVEKFKIVKLVKMSKLYGWYEKYK